MGPSNQPGRVRSRGRSMRTPPPTSAHPGSPKPEQGRGTRSHKTRNLYNKLALNKSPFPLLANSSRRFFQIRLNHYTMKSRLSMVIRWRKRHIAVRGWHLAIGRPLTVKREVDPIIWTKIGHSFATLSLAFLTSNFFLALACGANLRYCRVAG